MTQPAPQPDPRRTQIPSPAAAQPGIINDLPPQPAAAPQSMIINDLNPPDAATPAQQMIINDLPTASTGGGGQQMVVNDINYPETAAGAQQMVVNDNTFNELVKGLEALTRGEIPRGGQMIINDLTPAAPAPTANSPMTRSAPPSPPGPAASGPRPIAPAPQTRVTAAPTPVPQPQQTRREFPAAPTQVLSQPALPQPTRTVVPPQQAQPPHSPQTMAPVAAAPAQATGPRPLAPADPRPIRQAAPPQPMVINTPQPRVKPRREDMMPQPQAVPAPLNRILSEAPARTAGPVPPAARQSATAPITERRAAAPRGTAPTLDTVRQAGPSAAEWKGSFSGRAMTPSLILCAGLSILAVWFTLRFLPRDWYLEFLAATVGGIWLLQLVRWGYRVCGYRYRLTSEHLHLHRGLLYGRPVQVPRGEIVKVTVSASLVQKMLGVGTIIVEVHEAKDGKGRTVELEGVLRPTEVMPKITSVSPHPERTPGR